MLTFVNINDRKFTNLHVFLPRPAYFHFRPAPLENDPPRPSLMWWTLCCDCPFACCPNGWEVQLFTSPADYYSLHFFTFTLLHKFPTALCLHLTLVMFSCGTTFYSKYLYSWWQYYSYNVLPLCKVSPGCMLD